MSGGDGRAPGVGTGRGLLDSRGPLARIIALLVLPRGTQLTTDRGTSLRVVRSTAFEAVAEPTADALDVSPGQFGMATTRAGSALSRQALAFTPSHTCARSQLAGKPVG